MFHDVIEIKTVQKEVRIDKRTADIAMNVMITSDVRGLGRVTGKQAAGLELGKNTSKNDTGWKIIRVVFDQ